MGLVYFGARYLNTQLQRWVSADPLEVHIGGADPNLYAYVNGWALKSVDPLGLKPPNTAADAAAKMRGDAQIAERIESGEITVGEAPPQLPHFEGVTPADDTDAVTLGMAVGAAGALTPAIGSEYAQRALDYAEEHFTSSQYTAFAYGVATGAFATGVAAATSMPPTAAGAGASCAPSAGGGCVAGAVALTYEAAVVATASAIELVVMAHGNSKSSNSPQHGYDVYDNDEVNPTTGQADIVKSGVSGKPLNKDGSSPRANAQVNKLNKAEGRERYSAEVHQKNVQQQGDQTARERILKMEKQRATENKKAGNTMRLHKRPKPEL